METLETMVEFFTSRVVGYDEHMLLNVEGCKEGYIKMAQLVPDNTKTLLDLGCGTGLELEDIFKKLPDVKVTGIDLTAAMLEKLNEKYSEQNIELICGDYFKTDFGVNRFDCSISFETMHHFSKDSKIKLYKKIYDALTDNGCYIECDYMVESQAEEDLYFKENDEIRAKLHITADTICHYDTPCTIHNQIEMFKVAGFSKAEHVFRVGGTSIIIAYK